MILVLNRKGKYSMYNFDELTSISLLISLYIAVAFYIYFQQKREWKNIVELPFNSNNYSVAHPALSPDDKELYFASNMPGTLGQSDIFKVVINSDGTFSNPVNLGKTVNTEGRETFPFI